MNNNFKELTDFLDEYIVRYIIHSDCVEVEGDLWLIAKGLTSLPESFGNLKIGHSLWLNYNKLTSLPESFGNLQIGRCLLLDGNHLTSLPESIGNLKIGRSLSFGSIYDNFTSLPDSFFLSGLYRKTIGIKNLDELYSNFLKQEREKKEAEEKAKRQAEEQEEMIRFKSQIWVI